MQSSGTKLLYGSGDKTQPDGTSTPTPGYLSLNGRAALDARPQTEAQIDQMIKNLSGQLSGPAQQVFTQRAESYKNSLLGQIGAHADSQANTWYKQVNDATSANALTTIANNPDDPIQFRHGLSQLVDARLKIAGLDGAVEGDEVWNAALTSAKQDALSARVLAIGATDPSRALDILKEGRTTAGVAYDNLYQELRRRADQADGDSAAGEAFKLYAGQAAQAKSTSYANPSLPIYRQAVTDIPGGMSAAGLARTVQIESGGDPTAANASDHVGLGQFSQEAASEVGITDRKDPTQSIMGIQKYAAINAKPLTAALGRPPTDAELYLAHQQGAGGLIKLMQNPDAPAASLIGAKAVIQNGGTQGMTSAQFVAMWTHKFNGSTPQAGEIGPVAMPGADTTGTNWVPQTVRASVGFTPPPVAETPETPPPLRMQDNSPIDVQSSKAQAVQAILDNPDLTPEARTHALSSLNQLYAAEATADATTQAAKKQASDQAANGYMTKILTNDTQGLDTKIAQDSNLEWNTKESLTNALLAHANTSASAATATYGPGFWEAWKQVSAEAGDPSRIADVGELLRRAGPGGDLTLAGVEKLSTALVANQKSVDDTAVNTTKTGLMAYAKSKLDYTDDSIPLQYQKPDEEGRRIFNSQFIPKFNAAYDQWVKAGKDPWQFLTKDNVDKLADGMRNPREMAMAKLMAEQTGLDVSQITAPPTPQGIDDEGWKLILTEPPKNPVTGQQLAPENWQGIVETLLADPSDVTKSAFDAHFAAFGVTAADVLGVLTPPGGTLPKFAPKPVVAAAAPSAPKPPVDVPDGSAGVENLILPALGG